MGFFKKLKKGLRKGLSLAVKTAPIWSSFVPGGSIAGKVIAGATKAVEVRNKVRSRLRGLRGEKRTFPTATPEPVAMPEGPVEDAMERSQDEEGKYDEQGVGHAGIKGLIMDRPYNQMLTPSSLAGLMARRQARPRRRIRKYAAARPRRRAKRRTVTSRSRRLGRMRRGVRRRAA